jgi:hypothetical protein
LSKQVKRRVVHLFDPSSPRTCGFNPLQCPADTDPSVIAGNMVEAVERGWGDEDSQERPTMRRGLRAVFPALAELGLTLLEAPLFLMIDDPYRARAWPCKSSRMSGHAPILSASTVSRKARA